MSFYLHLARFSIIDATPEVVYKLHLHQSRGRYEVSSRLITCLNLSFSSEDGEAGMAFPASLLIAQTFLEMAVRLAKMKTLILSSDPLFLKRMAEILDPSSPLLPASDRDEALRLLVEDEHEFDVALIDSAIEKEPITGLLPLLFQQFPSVGRILILRNENDTPSLLAHYSVKFSSLESIRQRVEMAKNWSQLFRQHQQLVERYSCPGDQHEHVSSKVERPGTKYFSTRPFGTRSKKNKVPLFEVEENGKTNGHDREEALRRSNGLLRKLATTDPLTGIGNRRVLSQQLQRELLRAKRYGRALSLLFIDIDYFKPLNDRYGHAVGDQMLRELAQYLMSSVRRIDIIARYGGEEFVIILPETMKEHALMLADRIRRKVARYPFGQAYSIPPGTLTVSIGVASYPEDGTSATRLIAHADQALYSAKRQGRNLVLGAPLS